MPSHFTDCKKSPLRQFSSLPWTVLADRLLPAPRSSVSLRLRQWEGSVIRCSPVYWTMKLFFQCFPHELSSKTFIWKISSVNVWKSFWERSRTGPSELELIPQCWRSQRGRKVQLLFFDSWYIFKNKFYLIPECSK